MPGAGAEHAGGGLVVVAEGHGDAGGGEGCDGQEAAAFDIGAAQVGDGEDRIGLHRLLGVTGMQTDLGP